MQSALLAYLCGVRLSYRNVLFFFFFNDTATTEIYTLSLHDALPIYEAALFAADLVRMYTRYGERRGWKIEVVSLSEGNSRGLKEAIFAVRGPNAYGSLRYESGVHRVQRIPETEAQGRRHTSAATVAVLPEAEEVDVKIEEKDLRIDVFRSGGPGGQSVNTTDSAVRV